MLGLTTGIFLVAAFWMLVTRRLDRVFPRKAFIVGVFQTEVAGQLTLPWRPHRFGSRFPL